MYAALHKLASVTTRNTLSHLYLSSVRNPLCSQLKLSPRRKLCTNQQSESDCSDMELKKVVRKLDLLAPPTLAGSWDNVGILVEPTAPFEVKSILLTNDLTEPVMEEAMSKQISLILSYHPPIFKPLKRLTQRNWKERVIIKCLENRVALYSPHTCYDALQGGVNDWLILPFCDESCVLERITSPGYSTPGGHRLDITVPEDATDEIMSQMTAIPGVALMAKMSTVLVDGTAFRLSFNCTENGLPRAVSCVKRHEVVHSSMEILQLSKPPVPDHGLGRQGKLDQPISIKEAVGRVKSHLKLTHLRLALAVGATQDSQIKSVAVCAGSGGSVLRGIKADLYVTGEMSHHEVLEANHGGTSVILCDHSNTERGFLREWLVGMLQKTLGDDIEILVSECDRDPLEIV